MVVRSHLFLFMIVALALLAACETVETQQRTPSTSEEVEMPALSGISTSVPYYPTPTILSMVTPMPLVLGANPQSFELQRLRQYLRQSQTNLLELYQNLPLIPAQQQQQLGESLVQFADELAGFMTSLEPIVAGMTPENRESATGTMQRLVADIQAVRHPPSTDSPITPRGTTPTPLPETNPGMAEALAEMATTRQQLPSLIGTFNSQQRQAVLGSMADTVGDLDELMGYSEAAYLALSPEKQESLADQMELLFDIGVRLRWDNVVPTPEPSKSATLP